MINRSRKYNIIFALGWIANLVLCSLVTFVLARAFVAIADPDHWVLVSFWIHILLFISFSVAFLFFLVRRSYVAVVLATIFTVFQFLCVLITSLTLIADDNPESSVDFKNDPILWIKSRHWIPILFSIIFLPLFALQIFLINRYAGHLGLGSSRKRNGERERAEERVMVTENN